ncbi:MAG: heat-shock protein Hsp70 [Spirochaetaceae bacterium]|nr:MAG: heat-shock protein Hsp70 [Spirochaetaceae bacterium]
MKRIIGIDLGTTNSAAAFWDGDEPRIIPNDRGKSLTPSVVSWTPDGEVLVGESAKNQSVLHIDRTVSQVKRSMGTGASFVIDDHSYSPVDVSSLILAKLKLDAEKFLGESIERAVITVPAHYGESARAATIKAGQACGLEVVRILNEPTAAALCEAGRTEGRRRILVYDLGGGTFDATCLHQDGRAYTVKSTAGDRELGGLDFDAMLLEEVLEAFAKQTDIELRAHPALLQQIRDSVERAKVELSSRLSADVSLPFIGTGGSAVHLSHTISREAFSQLVAPLLRKTIKITLQVVREAGFGVQGIDALIVSGGSSRIPLVHTYLQRSLGLDEVHMINPDEVVALGAAVQAGMIERGIDTVRVTDVAPQSLGVETFGDCFVPIVRRNTPIPARSRRVFTTVSDNQTVVEIHVLQGESELVSENTSLGRFVLSGIRKAAQGQARIEVGFSVNEDGLVEVDAHDVDTGVRHSVSIEASEQSLGSGSHESEIEGIRARVQMLFDRLRSEIDEDLAEETSHFLNLAWTVGDADTERRYEIVAALGALADELSSYADVAEVRSGTA